MGNTGQDENRTGVSGQEAEDRGIPGDYEMEELLPIVAKLANSYTAWESTSVTYEKAEQLMEAVLYSIRQAEAEKWEDFIDMDAGEEAGEMSAVSHGKGGAMASGSPCPVPAGKVSAKQAYETGKEAVEKKVKRALELYHKILPDFSDYGNRCLRDTFMEGIPEFFKWYDVKYAPQDTILTLDYPVLQDISHYTGIDRIYGFLNCIRLEQRFLHFFPADVVTRILTSFNGMYEEMIENVCETVFTVVTGRGFLQKILPEYGFSGENEMKEYLSGSRTEEIRAGLEQAGAFFLKGAFGEDLELREYLFHALPGMAARLKNAAENGGLWRYMFQENNGMPGDL